MHSLPRCIPSTEYSQLCLPWQQGHAAAQLRERLADVSLAVHRGRGHRRRRSVGRLCSA